MKLKQLPKDGMWTDETGLPIPYNRTTALERMKEKNAFAIFSKAKSLNEKIIEFKTDFIEKVNEVIEKHREEFNVKLDGKGNYTFHNFDKSIRIETNVNTPVSFDTILIASAKERLFNIFKNVVEGGNEDGFMLGILEDAFQTSAGKLDSKKVLSLKKHSQRIKNKELKSEYEECMNIIDKAITRPSSKNYYKVWLRDDEGIYQPLELNFSAI